MNKKTGFISLLLTAIAFSSFGIWIRLLNQYMGLYEQIVLRNVFALFFALLFASIQNAKFKELSKAPTWKTILYGLSVPVAVVLYNLALLNNKIATATFTFYIGTIGFSQLFAVTLFKERLTSQRIAALALVAIGLFFFTYPFNATSLNFGLLAGIASGLADAISNGFRKNLTGKINKFILVLITAIGGIIVSGVAIYFFPSSIAITNQITTFTVFIGAWFGFLLVFVNYLMLVGFQNFELGPGVIILSTELFFTLIFGLLIFLEVPSNTELIGGICIMLASIIPNLKLKKSRIFFIK